MSNEELIGLVYQLQDEISKLSGAVESLRSELRAKTSSDQSLTFITNEIKGE